MAPTLTHVALQVGDLSASVAFYQRYCGLHRVRQRGGGGDTAVVWVAEAGRERELVFVLIEGAGRRPQSPDDFSHLGFAVDSREAVDAAAERARAEGRLVWAPRQDPAPVGYHCGIADPDGNVVELSYGQPLGPEGRAASDASPAGAS